MQKDRTITKMTKLRLVSALIFPNSIYAALFTTRKIEGIYTTQPVISYASETQSLTNTKMEKLKVTQRKLGKSKFVQIGSRIHAMSSTKVEDIAGRVDSLKWRRVSYLARRKDERCNKKSTFWRHMQGGEMISSYLQEVSDDDFRS